MRMGVAPRQPAGTSAETPAAAATVANPANASLALHRRPFNEAEFDAATQWVEDALLSRAGRLQRDNGFSYAVDVAQYMTYAAMVVDTAQFRVLRTFVLNNLVLNSPSDPYTAGMVLWRYSPAQPPDASGTTEALRVAEALWLGRDLFGDTTGIGQLRGILHGYARHEYVEQETWFIRNYFNVQTRAFATNSFLVDYDPDFLAMASTALGDTMLARVARESYAIVRKAIAPSGLLYEIVQPEILTALPMMKVPIFSPNDIISLPNSCTVAERVVRGDAALARGVLDFAVRHRMDKAAYFYGRTGEAVRRGDSGLPTISCLVRLATRLDAPDAALAFLSDLLDNIAALRARSYELDLFAAVETQWALHEVRRIAFPIR